MLLKRGTGGRVMSVKKIRPDTEVEYSFGNDGRDGHYYIKYSCPICHKSINHGYNSETACDECGTFYDWGMTEPTIKVTRSVKW